MPGRAWQSGVAQAGTSTVEGGEAQLKHLDGTIWSGSLRPEGRPWPSLAAASPSKTRTRTQAKGEGKDTTAQPNEACALVPVWVEGMALISKLSFLS